MGIRAFIAGCAGLTLSALERAFFTDARPWGFILFARNIDNPAQVSDLISQLRNCVGRSDAPVLIDQEGGRVARLRPPHWPIYPPAARFATLPDGAAAAQLGARLIAADLHRLGITVDCLPCADLSFPQTHAVIGDRAYGRTADSVAILARAAAAGLLAGGVLPVVKHIPGHGRATTDSHHQLPIVETPRAELERTDFDVFRQLADLPMAMTAHVVYAAIDPDHPATTSRSVISEVIRGSIGFDGLLMSDDLSMQALSGSLRSRTEAAFAAGCDVALHCNGDLSELTQVAAASPLLAGAAAARATAALACARVPEALDEPAARRAFSAMIGEMPGGQGTAG